MKEFNGFLKTVGGNEGDKCNYPTRLDTYGCGCQHDCSYCYAKSLLEFRRLWHPQAPSVANIEKVRKAIRKIPAGTIVRLGGMTDCFQPLEKTERVTYETIKALNEAGVGYLIVTKSALVAEDEYLDVLDKNLAHIQITVTCFDDALYRRMNYEKASLPSDRIKAIEKLESLGYDVQLRLSPFIPELVDFDVLNAIRCKKILVEFLRVNTWIKRWFNIDFWQYTLKQGGYQHLPLERKKYYLTKIHGFEQISVCEDEDEAYRYWRDNVNPDAKDCCNLRK